MRAERKKLPSTPTVNGLVFGRFFLACFSSVNLFHIFCSALSLIAQVFKNKMSADSSLGLLVKPDFSITEYT